MTKIKKSIKQELEELYKINLNGGWETFKDSLEEIRWDMGELSDDERRALRCALKKKLDNCDL